MDVRLVALKVGVAGRVTWFLENDVVNVTDVDVTDVTDVEKERKKEKCFAAEA